MNPYEHPGVLALILGVIVVAYQVSMIKRREPLPMPKVAFLAAVCMLVTFAMDFGPRQTLPLWLMLIPLFAGICLMGAYPVRATIIWRRYGQAVRMLNRISPT